jgi:DNA-directed RNA polymerase subunit RPC12/RpoP
MFLYCSASMPYDRVILGPRYALRLEDLQATDAIEVECPACRRRALVATHRLHDRFAPIERLTQICRRMRCRRCGGSGGMGWNVVRAAPQTPKT